MFNETQMKDLVVFNAFKAMQFELLAAQNQQAAQQLGAKVDELTAEVVALKQPGGTEAK